MTPRRRSRPAGTAARERRAAWEPRLDFPDALPVSARRDDIAAAIAVHPVVIVAGDTGSGKTTQLPKICLASDRGIDGQIALTQPRRLAAHAVANRLVEETGLPLGQGIGVQVRFDDRSSPAARVRVMTDGILLNEIARDRTLSRYDTVIIDEAHERSLNIDFLLGCLRRALDTRADLKVIVTSATINTQAFADFFGDAPVIDVEGRTFPVELLYRPPDDGVDTATAIHDAALELLERLPDGDVLVFLPGEREINEVRRHLTRRQAAPLVRRCDVLAVYGRLPDAEQRVVFRPGPARRILLATNVAETSLTLPRIRGVIDTGLVRISRYSARSKIQRLATERVSQASARQRAGRCGRIAPGTCVRLYAEDELAAQPAYTDPEVLRTDLASVTLRMLAAGLGRVDAFPWLDAPDVRRINDALRTLRELDAIDTDGRLRRTGRHLARLSVDPRLGRVLLAAEGNGSLAAALIAVAALAVGDPRLRPADRREAADAAHARYAGERADFESYLAIWRDWHAQDGGQRRWMAERMLSPRRMFDWRDIQRQLERQCAELNAAPGERKSPRDGVAALAQAFVAGFGVQVARLESDGRYVGPRGTRLALHPGSALSQRRPPWVIGLEFVRTRELFIRDVIAVKPRWVLHALRHLVTATISDARWDAAKRHPVATLTRSLDGLVLAVDAAVSLETHDPPAARELTIRHAIVRDEAELDAPFMTVFRNHNESIAAAEGRARRTLRFPDTAREQWFAERLPADVTTPSLLRRWLDDDPSRNDRLTVPLDVLAELPTADDDARPSHVELAGQRLALAYTYAPGRKGDGVALDLPRELANRVRRSDIDAAVPALLHERIELHLRKLPKSARVRLQPIGESARNLAERLSDSHDDLPFRDRLKLLLAAELGLDEAAFVRWPEIDDSHLELRAEILPALESQPVQAAATPATDWAFGALGPMAPGTAVHCACKRGRGWCRAPRVPPACHCRGSAQCRGAPAAGNSRALTAVAR